jgi:hypothetical protein
MLPLIETLAGFAAIMLMLSLLVKTLTSVIKNQWDFYSDNLRHEVQRLALETTGKSWDTLLQNSAAPDWAKSMHWERMGDELLTPAYMSWFLKQLDPNARVFDIDSRLKIHVANVKYTFEMRMKNLALAVGLLVCLLGNINAFAIWKSLYTDQQLRGKFAGAYADRAMALANGESPKVAASTQPVPATQPIPAVQPMPAAQQLNKSDQKESISSFQTNMQGFLTDVSFGVGRMWREECLMLEAKNKQECQKEKREQTATVRQNSRDRRYAQKMADAEKLVDPKAKEQVQQAAVKTKTEEERADWTEAELKMAQEENSLQDPPGILIYEFFGSLLTGIIVSIGAPYWHDFLQALVAFRPGKAKT